jgi:hypothetical protein
MRSDVMAVVTDLQAWLHQLAQVDDTVAVQMSVQDALPVWTEMVAQALLAGGPAYATVVQIAATVVALSQDDPQVAPLHIEFFNCVAHSAGPGYACRDCLPLFVHLKYPHVDL